MAPRTPVRTVIPTVIADPPDTPEDLYSSNLNFFLQTPWTASIIRSDDAVPLILQCRNPKSPLHDQLFGTTLLPDQAIPHMLSVMHLGGREQRKQQLDDPGRPIRSVSTLYHVGHGLTGGPGVLHGGMMTAMVDEAMGALTEVNSALGKTAEAFNGFSVTGALEVKFLRPIFTGTTVVVRARLGRVERRKARVTCEKKKKKKKNKNKKKNRGYVCWRQWPCVRVMKSIANDEITQKKRKRYVRR
ncbi:Thioesterase superfamily [Geosmithia morbida]|uniref:Thioesterase superfamily n=1 Tax=Geosmithia morbida TaxID=1094350 RepID=A0A9P4Z474_9HYPO|nr:Thioesterase superfamily [Geosmithia morbida]KAF4126943.1 Thioesterase superfamily [Geosmithia morbida]